VAHVSRCACPRRPCSRRSPIDPVRPWTGSGCRPMTSPRVGPAVRGPDRPLSSSAAPRAPATYDLFNDSSHAQRGRCANGWTTRDGAWAPAIGAAANRPVRRPTERCRQQGTVLYVGTIISVNRSAGAACGCAFRGRLADGRSAAQLVPAVWAPVEVKRTAEEAARSGLVPSGCGDRMPRRGSVQHGCGSKATRGALSRGSP